MITWGTAWVYRHRQLGRVVANCHKFPATDFERFRLSPEDIEQVYTDLLSRLHSRYPDMRVLFTVSPIRHWKDGAHANQLSKAVFQSLYMTSATEAWMKRIDKINKTLLHRPTDPDSSVYQELMKKTAQERERIERELSISFS